MIGVADPEVMGWAETARSTLERLRATPLRAALERALERGAAPAEASPPAEA
jgi:hypothetical protein